MFCFVLFFNIYIYIYIFIILFILFIYFWLCWVFAPVRGLPPVAASGGHSSSRCAGLSLSRPLLLRSTGSRRAGSAVVAHGPSRSVACGIFPDQGSNPCPLHWQADSQPLHHQGSPNNLFLICIYYFLYLFSLLFFGCSGSQLWCTGSLLRRAGFSLVPAHGFSLSSCGTWAPGRMGSVVCGTWALSLRRASLVALRQVGS